NDNGYLFVEMGLEYYKSFLEKIKEYNYEIKTYGESVLIIFRNM
ncbi:16S rRNA (guanine(966)-N(2))-methyltransferase RsmD, partial [Brachyspira pilosicoli]|nr:16S rRNA (guanine(966)-N(2))-methyltransferase RsmD [Brachyspira pilosicoli]